jgi:hemoglobin
MTAAGTQHDGTVHDIGTRDDVELLVRSFYREVAMDDLLGPIFHAAAVDWAAHVPKLVDFWVWQLLGEPGYDGNPLLAHAPVHAATPFRPEHYQRLLDLFEGTLGELFAGPIADLAVRRARKMAVALRRLLAGRHGPGGAVSEPVVGLAGARR